MSETGPSTNTKRRKRLRFLGAASGALIAAVVWIRVGPLPKGLTDLRPHQGVRVVASNGEVLYSTLSSRGARAQALSDKDMSDDVVAATLAAEDRRFFSHVGVDARAVVRAAWRNFRAGRRVEGGSTITQQTIDLLRSQRGSPSIATKVGEAILALRLEHRMPKREILRTYLSLAPYGNGRVGIVEASQFYFGVAPRDLTLAQAAYLAGLPQAPSRFDPVRKPQEAKRRQQEILSRLERYGLAVAARVTLGRAEVIDVQPQHETVLARHFVERVLEAHPSPTDGTTITTTIDPPLQREVLGILRSRRPELEEHGATAVAVAVLNNHTGEWLAWEGSGNYFGPEGAIDGVTTPRQPGSALKPFTYALAFERGLPANEPIPDIPSTFPTAESGILYKPRNYDGTFRGPLLPRVALASSVNVAAIWTLSQMGVEPLLHRLRALGFTTLGASPDYYGFGLTMGNAEVRLDELVLAYATFARRGLRPQERFLRTESSATAPDNARVFDPATAFLVSDILSDNDAREPGFGRGSPLEFPEYRVAVKTGTSQNYHDNWAIGFTGDVTVGVWVGNFSRRALRGSSGVTGAAPIFHAVMEAAMRTFGSKESDAPFRPVSGLRSVELCALSGRSPSAFCPRQVHEWLPNSKTLGRCDWHAADGDQVLVRWPADYRAWAEDRARAAQRVSAVSTAEPSHTRVMTSARSSRSDFAITSPPDGATYWIDPTLRRPFQALRLGAKGNVGPVRWRVNGRPIETASVSQAAPHWSLQPGTHTFEAIDAEGRKAHARIEVR